MLARPAGRALFLSPHFDDVAFSCGATLHALAGAGWDVTLCTVFTRSVPNPTGFALACQLDKGLAATVDYLALRRVEDDAAAARLGATRVVRLDLREAPHRGYESAAALFGPYASEDCIAESVAELLEPLLAATEIAFAPQALGNHVDHRRVADAVLAHASRRVGTQAAATCWYRDVPYAMRNRDATASVGGDLLAERAFEVSAANVRAKLDACGCYRSQLPFQFGDDAAMRRALGEFAYAEAARFQLDGAAEVFRSSSENSVFGSG